MDLNNTVVLRLLLDRVMACKLPSHCSVESCNAVVSQLGFAPQVYIDSRIWCTGQKRHPRCVRIPRYTSNKPYLYYRTACSTPQDTKSENQNQDHEAPPDIVSFESILEQLDTKFSIQYNDIQPEELSTNDDEKKMQHLKTFLGYPEGKPEDSLRIAKSLIEHSVFSDAIFGNTSEEEPGKMSTRNTEVGLTSPTSDFAMSIDGTFFYDSDVQTDDGLNPASSSFSQAHVPRAALLSTLTQVQQRRLNVEHSESLPTETASENNDSPVLPEEGDLRLSLGKSERELERHLLISSTRNARIISTDIGDKKPAYNSLTASAEMIAIKQSQFPFRQRPLVEIQHAFQDAESLDCRVCSRKVLKPDLREGFLCPICYSRIFTEIDSIDGSPQHKRIDGLSVEVRKAIDDVWDRRKLTKRKLMGGKMAFRANSSIWNSTAPPSGPSGQKPQTPTTISGSSIGSFDGRSSAGPPGSPPSPPTSFSASSQEPDRRDKWTIRASARSLRTINPIRNLVQGIDVKPNPSKELIKLSVGDPTLYGNLKVSKKAIDEYCKVIQSMKHNGYSMSYGSVEARTAIAERYTIPLAPLTPDDVVLASGTSGALELAIGALANEGDNILLPLPGFPLFQTIAKGFGIECRYYKLRPNNKWEINLNHLSSLADNRTAAIVINNPSNPCGSVYSSHHINEILKTASKLHLPIIADEVYSDMVFSECKFTSIGSQSVNVPVLSVGGISKQFVVPGWRLGWILIHDRNNVLQAGEVRKGIRQLTTRMLVPNTPSQAVIPCLLSEGTKDECFKAIMNELELNASFTVKALAKAPGLRCIPPQGAMYTMVEIDSELLGFSDDMEFTKALLREESVFVLPGQCFNAPNFVRIVFCAPQYVLSEAFHRIRRFCSRHSGQVGF